MKRLIQRANEGLHTPLAVRVFALVSFLESALIPIPVESIFLPLMVSRRREGWKFALIGTVTSVLGGCLGYVIGFSLLETVGKALIDFYKMGETFESIRQEMGTEWQRGGWMIFLGAVTPIPYKVVSIASGTLAYPFLLFMLISVVGRGLRYFGYAAAFALFGDTIAHVTATRPRLVGAIVAAVMVAGFAALAFTW
jgi:membrane protein YqaA with SNARE-associated domain